MSKTSYFSAADLFGSSFLEYFSGARRFRTAFWIIVVSAFAAYSRSFWGDFQFDDHAVIVDNPLIKNLDLPALWEYDRSRFLTNLTFLATYLAFKLNVFGWHLVNLLIHIMTSFFVFLFSFQIFQMPRIKNAWDEDSSFLISLFTALIFLLHPIQTQAVTYIVQRSTVLAGFFYVATLYFFFKGKIERNFKLYLWAIVFCFLGMLSKPIIATLPLVVILVQLCFFKDDEPDTGWRERVTFLCFVLPMLAIPLFLFGMGKLTTLVTQSYLNIPQPSYLFTQFNVMMKYLQLLFVPIGQNLDYDFRIVHNIFEFPTYLSLAGIFLLIFIATTSFNKRPLVSFGIFIFFIALLPDSSIFPLADVINEHRVYLSCFGFAILLCTILHKFFKDKKAYIGVMVAVVAVFSVLTYVRNDLWSNGLRFMQDVVAKSPQKSRPHNNLGYFYFSKGKFQEAQAEYLKALSLDPDYFTARYNLAMVYLETGNIREAEKLLLNLAGQYPDHSSVCLGLGLVAQKKGDFDAAMDSFNRAISLDKFNASAYAGLGNLYSDAKRTGEAKSALQESLRLDPQNPFAHYNLGNIYFTESNFYEALMSYQQAIQLKPDLADALNNLGNVFFYFGDFQKSIENYEKAISHDPSLAQAYFNLANALYESGRLEESRESARQAVKLYRAQGQTKKAEAIEEKLNENKK
ncbi:MAG: tetratricopeptide repeat protein [Candidatus Omnitrophota bacterium]